MLLTISERFVLSSVLPPTGDILTLRDIRLLREDLAISKEDREEVQFFTEFVCPTCQIKDSFPAPVKCGKCDVWMKPTGQIGCSNWEFEKEVPIPDYISQLIIVALKLMEEESKKWEGNPNPPKDILMLTERHISIYEKFVEGKDGASVGNARE